MLDGCKALSYFFLPLRMLVQSVLNLMLVLFNGGERVPSAAHGNPWATDGVPCAGRGSHEQRRTCVLPGSRWRPPHETAAGSSQNCRPAIAHLGPVTRNSLNDEEKAAPTQHV